MFFAIEIDDGVAINRIERALRADRCIRFMVIIANPDKGEDFSRSVIETAPTLVCSYTIRAILLAFSGLKPKSKDTNRTLGNIQSAA